MLSLGESLLSGLIDSDMIGMVLHNNHQEIVWTNNTFMQMINRRNSPIPEQFSLKVLTPKEFQAHDTLAISSLKTSGTTKPYEKVLYTLDGTTLDVIVSHTRLRAKKKIFLSMFLNVSKSKRLEQLKNDFISITSHELKTPLTSMRAYTQLLQKSEANPEISEYLNKMLQLIDRQNSLINDLLDLSKIESDTFELTYEKVDIQKLIRQLVDDFHVKFPERKIVIASCHSRQIQGDRDRLYQVLANLVSNAIKYSPQSFPVVIDCTAQDGLLQICVKDRGLGIKKSERKKLFLRYSRIHSDTVQGLGLGLFIAKKIVEQHGGQIGVRSNKPRGSIFFFTLPLRKLN